MRKLSLKRPGGSVTFSFEVKDISISAHTARTMATSHFVTNVTVHLIVDTKKCPFLLSIVSVAIPIVIRYGR